MPSFELPQFWDDLTTTQAQEIFDNHVAEHPKRVSAAIDFLTELGVESRALDFSSISLEVLWPMVLGRVEIPDSPDTGWERGDMPPWAAFQVEASQRIGRRNIEAIEWIAAYFNECVLRADSRSHWRLGDERNASGYRKPLVVFPSGADMLTEQLVQKILTRAIDGEGPNAEMDAAPDGLRRHMDLRLAVQPSTTTEPTVELFEIHRNGPNGYHVTFSHDVDAEASAALDRLVAAAAGDETLGTVVREDDDILLVTSTKLGGAELLARLTEGFHQAKA